MIEGAEMSRQLPLTASKFIRTARRLWRPRQGVSKCDLVRFAAIWALERAIDARSFLCLAEHRFLVCVVHAWLAKVGWVIVRIGRGLCDIDERSGSHFVKLIAAAFCDFLLKLNYQILLLGLDLCLRGMRLLHRNQHLLKRQSLLRQLREDLPKTGRACRIASLFSEINDAYKRGKCGCSFFQHAWPFRGE